MVMRDSWFNRRGWRTGDRRRCCVMIPRCHEYILLYHCQGRRKHTVVPRRTSHHTGISCLSCVVPLLSRTVHHVSERIAWNSCKHEIRPRFSDSPGEGTGLTHSRTHAGASLAESFVPGMQPSRQR